MIAPLFNIEEKHFKTFLKNLHLEITEIWPQLEALICPSIFPSRIVSGSICKIGYMQALNKL